MEAGALTRDGGFSAWSLGPRESLERIEREWRSLGRDPNIPDICWFANTDAGDRTARARLRDH